MRSDTVYIRVCVCVCVCVCRWPLLRTWSLSLVRGAQTRLGWFPCSGGWSTVSHSHWSENKKKKNSHAGGLFMLKLPSPLSWAPGCFSSALAQPERALSAQPTFEPILSLTLAHSFVILAADALHLNSSPTFPRGLYQGSVHFFFFFWFFSLPQVPPDADTVWTTGLCVKVLSQEPRRMRLMFFVSIVGGKWSSKRYL